MPAGRPGGRALLRAPTPAMGPPASLGHVADSAASAPAVSCIRRRRWRPARALRNAACRRSRRAWEERCLLPGGRLARQLLLLAKPGGKPRALQRRQVFDEDLADQVVHFMLDAHGKRAFGGKLEPLAALVL